MLTVREAIRERRAVRKFKPDPVPDEYILEMLEAARLAPSGHNRQPWRFLVVTDPEEKRFIEDSCRHQHFIGEAPVVFVCAADLSAFSKLSERLRYEEFIEYGVFDTFSGDLTDHAYWEKGFLSGPEPDPRAFAGAALANTYIAIEHLVLTATALGLGTCWVQARPATEALQKRFGWPEHIMCAAVIPCGYPAFLPSPRPRLALEELLLRPLPMVASHPTILYS
ncbi:MAG: nitroreductase family protein [Chloroflexi bacterium]|nr:nitroreductase family protein [Chloroflexota bacterium]